MIRSAKDNDSKAILEVAGASGLFQPPELEEVSGMLAAHFAGESGEGHEWLVDDVAGDVMGAAYYAPEPFTEGVWNLYMLVVHPKGQGKGQGKGLVRFVENALRQQGERVLLVETSGVDSFARTRAFYSKLGFDEEARIRDYYKAGDDKVVFWKSLVSSDG